jgi:DNA modification methylase
MQSESVQGALTKEEQRVASYGNAGPEREHPTVAGEVTPETPLEKLNLNWPERALPEKERTKHVHRLHPYLGKYIPQLVEIFLRKYFSAGQTVLDPFCGSGTTLVQANELAINSIGCDVSAFNVMLCRAKTARYDLALVRREVYDALDKVHAATQTEATRPDLLAGQSLANSLLESFNAASRQYLETWFAPAALGELLTYRHLIETEGYKYGDLLKVILSRSARSSRLTTHFDLDFPKKPQTKPYQCFKHSRECRPTTDAFKFLKRYSLDTLKRIEQYAGRRTNAGVRILHADSREAKFPPVDGVVTSPPYVGLIDYHEQHAYAYHLLGLKDRRADEIGPAASGSSKKAQHNYQHNIAEVFKRAARKMPSGGRMIVIAGDKSKLYGEIAALVGVEVEAVVERHVNRRTGRRAGEFYESIFIWRKP